MTVEALASLDQRAGITSPAAFAIPRNGEARRRRRAMMKKALVPAAIFTGAGLAMAASLNLFGSTDLPLSPAAIAIVSGGIEASVDATSFGATPGSVLAPSNCTALTASAGAITPAPGTSSCGFASHVTLQDRVWFGAYWQLLATPIVLGGGYTNARIERTSDGNFFSGIVDKVDANGRVTDVILAFAGAQGNDAVQGEAILLGLPLDEAARATRLYERLVTDPRYANARIHVTGHSLGAGYTQYILAYALATHGTAATDARADFLAFGAPNWLASAAAHFKVDPELAAARMVDFTAANDPVLLNGVVRIGINNYVPSFSGLPGLGAALNVIGAHWPTTYAAALGLPAWLSSADRNAATSAISAQFNTGNSISPSYGPAGKMPLTVDGSNKAEWIEGLGGADRLIGHGGGDILTGSADADRFVYLARTDSGASSDGQDHISDFSQAEGDRIDLTALAVLPLRFTADMVCRKPGEVCTIIDGGDTLVMINLNGGSDVDMVIRVSGRIPLTGRDFDL